MEKWKDKRGGNSRPHPPNLAYQQEGLILVTCPLYCGQIPKQEATATCALLCSARMPSRPTGQRKRQLGPFFLQNINDSPSSWGWE